MTVEWRVRKTVHYDAATGKLHQWGFGFHWFDVEGWSTGMLPDDYDMSTITARHTVDISAVAARALNDEPPLVTLIEPEPTEGDPLWTMLHSARSH